MELLLARFRSGSEQGWRNGGPDLRRLHVPRTEDTQQILRGSRSIDLAKASPMLCRLEALGAGARRAD